MNMTLDAQALASLFEISRDAVMGIDKENIVFANPTACSLLGAAPGLSLVTFLPKYMRELLAEPSEHFVTAATLKDRDGTLSVHRLEELTILTFVPQQAPTSSHQQLLRQIADALFTLRLAADGVLRDVPLEDNSKQAIYASIMYKSYYQLNRLYQHISMLDALVSQTLPRPTRLLDAEHVCDQLYRTVEPLMRGVGITIEYHADAGIYDTLMDRTHLETLVLNLLANSLGHTKAGQSIEIGLRRLDDRILLSVIDTGSGIDANTLADLFNGNPSVKTTDIRAGAGLGLPLVRGLAEYYGGAVMLESKPNKGTSIRVSLPIRLPKQTIVHSPPFVYGNNDGMNTVLTELSVVLDKEFYTQKMFD
jgi:signal transduction histidine kinase